MQIHHRPLSLPIDTSGKEYTKEFNLDTNVSRVYGLKFGSDFLEKLYFRGNFALIIDGKEIIPFGDKGYPAKELMSSLNVKSEDRFNKWIFGEKGIDAGNKVVKLRFKDTNHPSATFSPYQLDLLFLVQI